MARAEKRMKVAMKGDGSMYQNIYRFDVDGGSCSHVRDRLNLLILW